MSMTKADMHGKRANRARGAKSDAEWAQDLAQTKAPKRRVPVDLDPGNFAPKVGTTDDDANDPVLRSAQSAFSAMHDSLTDLHKREKAIFADRTATPSAKNLKMRSITHKVSDATAKKLDNAYRSLQSEIGQIDRAIERAFNGRQPEAKAQEIRSYLRSLSAKDRRQLLSEGDPDVLSAVLSAKPFLSGATPADAMRAKHDATEMLFPDEIKRRGKLERAAKLIDERSHIWMKEYGQLYDHEEAERAAQTAEQARLAAEFGE